MNAGWTYRSLMADKEAMDRIQDPQAIWKVRATGCPECGKISIFLGLGTQSRDTHWAEEIRMVRPKGVSRDPLSPDVPAVFAEDYLEAVAVFADSPKASAALSRRCLQHLIREHVKIHERDLFTEIQKLIDRGTLPSHLSEALDSVRVIGNFAAHPAKSESTGEIVSVEPGEAEWLLDTLEGLFDFYFTQPAVLKRKKDALAAKLADTRKPAAPKAP